MKTFDNRECRHSRHIATQCLPAARSIGTTITVPTAMATGTTHGARGAPFNPYPVVLLAMLDCALSLPDAVYAVTAKYHVPGVRFCTT